MSCEKVREIVDVFLVKCDKGVIALCSENDTKKYIQLGVDKNIKITTKKITTNLDRVNQIGNNLFNVNYPCKNKTELIKFRNDVIGDWMKKCDSIKNANQLIVWSKVAQKYKVEATTVEEFSQSIMDKIEYL